MDGSNRLSVIVEGRKKKERQSGTSLKRGQRGGCRLLMQLVGCVCVLAAKTSVNRSQRKSVASYTKPKKKKK